MEAGIKTFYYFVNQLFYTALHDNLGLQTAYNAFNIISNNRKINTEDTSNTVLKKNKQKKELKKKDEVVRSEDIEGYRGDKTIDEVLKFIGDESSDNKKNKACKIKNKIKSGNEKGNDCDRPKNGETKMSIYNSVEEVYTTVFQPIDSLDDESKLIKSSKKGKKKVPKQNLSFEKFTCTEQTLDVLSSKPQDTDSADVLLVTNKQRRRKQKSQNKLNATISNCPTHDSDLLSPYTQPKSVKNKKKRKSTSSLHHSNKFEDNSNLDSVHSLIASSTFSEQPSYKEAPKTDMTKPACVTVVVPPQSVSPTVCVPKTKKQNSAIIMYNNYEVDESLSFGFEVDQHLLIDSVNDYSPPVSISTPIEYNYEEVVLFVKQAWQDVEKEKIDGKSNILEYK